LAKLNELKDKIEEKRRELGGAEQLRRQLENLKGLGGGPTQELASALRQGDYSKAMEALQQLKQKLTSDALSEADKKELAAQLESLQRKLQELQQQYEEARRELETKMAAAQRTGNLEAANQLQQKLDQLRAMQSPMNQLNRMAQALGQAAESLQQGDSRRAAEQLQQAASQLAQMQAESETLQACETMLDELETMSEAWSDDPQLAASENFAPGGMGGSDSNNMGGRGLGRGRGYGDRPEQATDTQSYESRVAAKLQRGKAVVTGSVGGPNVPGESFQSIQQAIQSDYTEQTDPIEDIRLPRDQQQHTKEYFQKFVKP
jgi:myosin heavy subunit